MVQQSDPQVVPVFGMHVTLWFHVDFSQQDSCCIVGFKENQALKHNRFHPIVSQISQATLKLNE